MRRAILQSGWLSPFTVSVSLVFAFTATAAELPLVEQPGVEFPLNSQLALDRSDAALDQVTSVSQLSDVQPGDWAFQALQTLVERYGCIAGYPDRTYRGNRAVTRYEFAAGLNACLDKIQETLQATAGTYVRQEDWQILKGLQAEFAPELATLQGRISGLEGRMAVLEKQQFSATTTLQGEVAFAVTSAFGDRKADGSGDLENQPVFDYSARLLFNTSFTGKDQLAVRLDALNRLPFGSGEEGFPNITGTGMTRLSLDEATGGAVQLGKLSYRFGLGYSDSEGKTDEPDDDKSSQADDDDNGARITFVIDAVGGEFNENMPNFNEYFAEELTGAISRFGHFNPIYYQGLEGTGASVHYQLNEVLALSAGYLAPDASDPNSKAGLFRGAFAALAQVSIQPTESLQVGLTYVRSYFPGGEVAVSGETGSELANEPFGEVATAADNFGLQTSIRLSPKVTLSGWAGLSRAYAKGADAEVRVGDRATIFNWAATLALPDFGKKGNLLGVIIGQPPKVTHNDVAEREDGQTAFHLETLYRYQVTDHISVTPGFLVIFNPDHDGNNDTIYVGTLKTVFQF